LRHLGFEDVAFYEGSLTEWLEDGRPLEGERADEITVEEVR
jgi:thiosulfate/3-mercaptopyruvate sulfurtransferase